MKRILFLLTLSLSLSCLQAQTLFFSTDSVNQCEWNDDNKKFDNCTAKKANSTLFKLNSSQSMFTHTTETMASSYYVKSHKYDEKYDVYEYEVTSDVGNKYTFFIDTKNSQIRILGTYKSSGGYYLITHYFKSSWKEE